MNVKTVMLLAGLLAATAHSGPAWVEPDEDDAGALPGDAQVTEGDGMLDTISGTLGGAGGGVAGADDFEDMYVILIEFPASFSATTAFSPGTAEFDSRLFLFELSGDGLLGNEDTSNAPEAFAAAGPIRFGRGLSLSGGFGPPALPGDIVGACCFPDGTCDELLAFDCARQGGVYQGPGTDCKTASCDEFFGACCLPMDCQELLFTDCVMAGGAFVGDGTDCGKTTCDFFGACCFPDGTCENLFDFDCERSGGTFRGGGTSCLTEECAVESGSTLGNASTDGTNIVITDPGLYLLAITVTPRNPVSAPLAPIFDFMGNDFEVSGPDGPGGGDPINDWEFPIPAGDGGKPGDYVIYLTGTGFAMPETIEVPLDIKPGGCPNPMNRGSMGYLPVSVLGTADFDVSMIDLPSVVMLRGDGMGGSVSPHEGPPGPHTVIADTGTPFAGLPCDCHGLTGDGIPDLSMKFHTPQLVAELELDTLPMGEAVELVVTGTLADGTPFTASDCVLFVPPGTPGTVSSSAVTWPEPTPGAD